MTEEYKKVWLEYVKSKTPEGYFFLPLTPKNINNLTPEEFDLLDESDWQLIIEDGVEFFLCKKID